MACRTLILALLLCQAGEPLQSATPGGRPGYSIEVWENDRGLPQSSVLAMAQTSEGYLWLSTLNGLARFDGIQFTAFDENTTPELGSSPILHLFADSPGRLWIGTEADGIKVLEGGRIVSPPELSLGGPDRVLQASTEETGGAVWLANANGEVFRIKEGKLAAFLLNPAGSTPHSMITEKSGTVWIGTERRQVAIQPEADEAMLELPVVEEVPVARLDLLLASQSGGYWRLANGRVQRWSGDALQRDLGPYPWGFAPVTSACEDARGNLVVGTLGAGLFWYDPEGNAIPFTTEEGLSHNYILSLLRDREGTIWVGTDGGGLNRVRPQSLHLLEESRGMVVQSVDQDRQGQLWFGANSGGIARWTDASLQLFLPTLSVRAVFVDSTQSVWAGIRGAGLFRRQGDQFRRLPTPTVAPLEGQAFFEDSQGRFLVGTQSGLAVREAGAWRILTTDDGLSANHVKAIAEEPAGTLWIGTEGGGLNRWEQDRFDPFRHDDGLLPSDNITCLLVDAAGTLWVGTRAGLVRFRETGGRVYTTRDGLISNRISYMLQDLQGSLWIGTPAGLMRISLQALNDLAEGTRSFLPVRAFGKADGLPSAECTTGAQPAACLAEDGSLWFPTIKGLVWIDPARLRLNTTPPPVVIEEVLVDGRTRQEHRLLPHAPDQVTLPVGRQRLEVHYTSLNLGFPERARFKYRLRGLDDAWTDAGNVRVARFTKPPPGRYTFEVTACNEDGVWNEQGSSLAVVVLPPFWKTWWFLLGVSLLAVLGLVLVVHRLSTLKLQRQVARFRQQEALEAERARIARDIHDQVGANLTQVALLGELVESDKEDPAEIESHAQQISQTARETTRALDEIVWTVNPSNDTLESLVNYICKHAQDFLSVAGLRHRLDIPPSLPHITLPPEVRHNVFLAAKEAITNIVRHAQAREARLKLTLQPHQFILDIADDGRGLAGLDPDRAATRNGLRNMRRRMEDIGGSFHMNDAPEGGLLVRPTVPLQPA